MLGAVLARWSPIVVGLGTPGLALAVELAQAIAAPTAADHGEAAPLPAATEAARHEASIPSDVSPVEKSTGTELSLLALIAATAGLSTVAWAHAHLVRPHSARPRSRHAQRDHLLGAAKRTGNPGSLDPEIRHPQASQLTGDVAQLRSWPI